MKSSGYRSIFHIYLIFFLSLFGALTAAVILSFLLFSLQKPDGSLVRSDWPRKFTEQFGEQIVFTDGKPLLLQSGMELLQEEGIGFQILDASGREIYSFQRPEYAPGVYCFFSQKDRRRTDRGFVLPPHCPVIIAAFSIFP